MKNVIYGTGIVQKSFQYIFTNLKVDYYIDDVEVASENTFPVDYILEDTDYRIIICKEDSSAACQRLNEIGLKQGKNYLLAEELYEELNGTYYKSSDQIPDKLMVWGTGKVSHQFQKKFPQKEIVGYIDSNCSASSVIREQGDAKVLVKNPKDIENWREFFIVVAINLSTEVVDFLESKGLKRNEDFVTYNQITDTPAEMMKMVMDAPSRNYGFCSKPFEEVYVEIGGVIYLCCPYLLRDIDIGNLREHEFDEIWNSVKARIIRLSIIKRNFCFCEESFCSHFSKTCENNDDFYEAAVPKYPRKAMISFDDACNLKCPSCRKEFRFNNSNNLKQEMAEICAKKLEAIIPQIGMVSISGNGDPFYCNTYRKLWLNTSKMKRNYIRFQTNGLLLNEENIERIVNGYEIIDLYVSIDAATKETYERVRCGGNFEVLQRNMQMVAKMRQENKIREFVTSFVVQKENYHEIVDFVKMCFGYGVDYIEFWRLADWGLYSKEEFMQMSLYDDAGQMKPELAEILKHPIFQDKRINLNNL